MTARDVGWKRLVAGCVLILLGGCRPAAPDLEFVEIIPIPSAAALTLHVAADGRLWLGEPGQLTIVDGSGAPIHLTTPDRTVPRVIGEAAGRLLAQTGDGGLLLLDSSTGEMVASAEPTGQPFLEPRGRWAFVAGPAGEMLIHETDSLRVISAWGAVGMVSTAVAGSPEGDRIYQALSSDGGGTILTRDLQTGRVLRTSSMPAPVTGLQADRAGNLLAVVGDENEMAILSLRPWGDQLELRWRERVVIPAAGTRVRISPDGSRLAILPPDDQKFGLRVRDGETGAMVGALAERPLDGQFDARRRLLLLYPGEIRILR